MRTVLFVIFLACILQVNVTAEEARVMQKADGSYFIEPSAKDTGIRVESGLDLSSSQLEKVINGGQIHLDEEVNLIGWNKSYTHYVYETKSTRQALLDDQIIRAKEQVRVFRNEYFNPFYILALCFIFTRIWPVKVDILIIATFAFGVSAGIFATMDYNSSYTSFSLASLSAITAIWWSKPLARFGGILCMIVAMGLMFFI